MNMRSLLQPAIVMDPATLRISGTGPFDTSFTENRAAGSSSFAISGLLTGQWTVLVEALNSLGQVIGSGSTTVTIVHNQTAPAAILVRPLPGDGVLSIELSWPEHTLEEPVVTGRLVNTAEEETLIDFDVSATMASCTLVCPAGYYDLYISLDGTNDRSWTHYVAVRIVEAQETTGELVLQLNQHSGSLELTVSVDLLAPMTIAFVDVPPAMYYGQDAPVSVLLDPADTGTCQYAWLINGQYLSGEEEPALVLPATALTPGMNLLVVRVADGPLVVARSVVIHYIDRLPAPIVSAPAETTSPTPTWSWPPVENAVAYRYGFSEDDWISEDATAPGFTPESALPEAAYRLFVQAQDDRGEWSASGSAVTEVVINTAPYIASNPGNQQWYQDEEGPVLDLVTIFADADTLSADLVFAVSGGSQISHTLTGSIATFHCSPDFTGSESISFSATDDHPTNPKTVQLTLLFTVSAFNRPPTIDQVEDLELLVNAGLQTINLTGIGDGDPDKHQSLTVSAVSANTSLIPHPTVTYSSGATGSLSFTPQSGASGSALITVTVTDAGGTLPNASTSISFTVSVVSMTFTEVQGPIFSNTTWTAAASPYLFTGPASVSVEPGATLTIEPGVEIYVNPGFALLVKGTLSAIGSSEAPIRFIPANPLQPWVGIKFAENSIDATYDPGSGAYVSGSILKHAELHLAGSAASSTTAAIELNNAFPYLSDIVVTRSAANGIIALGDSGGTVKLNAITIVDSARDGLHLYPNTDDPTSVILEGLEISGSGPANHGIYVSAWSGGFNITIMDSRIHNNHGAAIRWANEISSYIDPVCTIDGLTVENNVGGVMLPGISSLCNSSFIGSGDISLYTREGNITNFDNMLFENNHGTISIHPKVNYSSYREGYMITNSTFIGNTGGIQIYGSWHQDRYVTIADCNFVNNTISGSESYRSNIYISQGWFTILRNLFEGNRAPTGYAVGDFNLGSAVIQHNTFANNDITEQQPVVPRFLLRLSQASYYSADTVFSDNYFVFQKRPNLYLIENGNSNTEANWDLSGNYWVTTDPAQISTFVYGSLYDSSRSDVNINPPLTEKPAEAPDTTF
jgi:hypothetical protein